MVRHHFQSINTTKYMSCLFVTMGIHINICVADVDKLRLSIYKDLQLYESSKKYLLENFHTI